MSGADTRTGTATGVLLSVAVALPVETLIHTVVLAGIGGATSFVVSYLLKRITRSDRK